MSAAVLFVAERERPATSSLRSLSFELPEDLIATRPVEALGLRRDDSRMLVSWRSTVRLVDAVFADLPRYLAPGNVLVVNTSATLPASVPTDDGRLVHFSTELPGPILGGPGPHLGRPGPFLGRPGPLLGRSCDLWVVELRRPCGTGSRPLFDAEPGAVGLRGGGRVELLAPFGAPPGPGTGAAGVRLWVGRLDLPVPLGAYLSSYGRPVRYGCSDDAWPISAYQTVFAREPGSAEMPSAARGFTADLVTRLVASGVVFAPITLHTGVSSQEAGEPPYSERFDVPATSAEIVNSARANGHRVIAVGTTATRAIETTADEYGRAHAGRGWTELVITPQRGVRLVDGIISGWHEPAASHLALLEAVGGKELLERSYEHAVAAGYRWHEFGDFHLILP